MTHIHADTSLVYNRTQARHRVANSNDNCNAPYLILKVKLRQKQNHWQMHDGNCIEHIVFTVIQYHSRLCYLLSISY